MDEDWQERFLKANANADYMASKLADCLRNCMRAVAASDPTSPRYRAVEDFDMLLKLMVRSEGVRLHEIFEKAIDELRPARLSRDQLSTEWLGDYRYERSIMSAAEAGLQFLVESSCADNAARGRASRRESDFLSAIRRIEAARQDMAREADARWQASKPTAAKRQRKKTE